MIFTAAPSTEVELGMVAVPFLSVIFAFMLSAVRCPLVVRKTRGIWARLPRSGDLHAVQPSHTAPALRLGGVAVFLALIVASAAGLGAEQTLWFWRVS